MDNLYGIGYLNFFVFIQTDDAKSGKFIWLHYFDFYLALSGINKLHPNWSYFLVRTYSSRLISYCTYFSLGEVGSGIDRWEYETAISVISQYEDGCTCERITLELISHEIYERIGWLFSIICDDKGVTHGLIYS
jgi:hypothetical protein